MSVSNEGGTPNEADNQDKKSGLCHGEQIKKIRLYLIRGFQESMEEHQTVNNPPGGSPQVLKTILGHSSLSMTMDLYSHVLPNTKQKEMDSINIAL